MSSALPWILLAFLAGASGTAGLFYKREQMRASGKRRHPSSLHVKPRRILTGTEREIWRWLQAVFPNHHIMVKMPMTRFTLPGTPDKRMETFSCLSNLYCSFTICTKRARVIGCIDIAGGRTTLSGSNQELKQAILSQCDMAYWVLLPQSLPEVSILRAAFLGLDEEGSDFIELEPNYSDIERMREHLKELVDREHNVLVSASNEAQSAAAQAGPDWTQADSFLMPLEEQRRLKLDESGS